MLSINAWRSCAPLLLISAFVLPELRADLASLNRSGSSTPHTSFASKQDRHSSLPSTLAKSSTLAQARSNKSTFQLEHTAFASNIKLDGSVIAASLSHVSSNTHGDAGNSNPGKPSKDLISNRDLQCVYQAGPHHDPGDGSHAPHTPPVCVPVAVPEPSSLILSISTLVLLGARYRKKASRFQKATGS